MGTRGPVSPCAWRSRLALSAPWLCNVSAWRRSRPASVAAPGARGYQASRSAGAAEARRLAAPAARHGGGRARGASYRSSGCQLAPKRRSGRLAGRAHDAQAKLHQEHGLVVIVDVVRQIPVASRASPYMSVGSLPVASRITSAGFEVARRMVGTLENARSAWSRVGCAFGPPPSASACSSSADFEPT